MFSRSILVTSGLSFVIDLAMPKSMSLSAPLTHRKFIGFRSPWMTRALCITSTADSICSQYPHTKVSLSSRPLACRSSWSRWRMPLKSISPHSITMYTTRSVRLTSASTSSMMHLVASGTLLKRIIRSISFCTASASPLASSESASSATFLSARTSLRGERTLNTCEVPPLPSSSSTLYGTPLTLTSACPVRSDSREATVESGAARPAAKVTAVGAWPGVDANRRPCWRVAVAEAGASAAAAAPVRAGVAGAAQLTAGVLG